MESVQLVLKLEDQLSGKLKKISRDSTRLERAVIKVQNQAVRLQQKAKQMGDTLGNAFNRARKGADGLAKKLNGIRGLASSRSRSGNKRIRLSRQHRLNKRRIPPRHYLSRPAASRIRSRS